MSTTRRTFIAVAGAALSAPVAAAAATTSSWPPTSGGRADSLEARLAKLEDLNELRALNQAFARHVTSGATEELAALAAEPSGVVLEPGVVGISHDGVGEHDVIEIAPDRQTATARLHVAVHTETVIGPDCPLLEMARQQGGGVISRAEPVVLEKAYVRRDGVWKILRVTAVRA
ncbi:MAG TPA: hypothetical protein VFD21_13665 [Vicinamibacterales bacterium]|jgi:hypothetical protein|nr:hypothetical protein [Vicinamibacterales bacterium]